MRTVSRVGWAFTLPRLAGVWKELEWTAALCEHFSKYITQYRSTPQVWPHSLPSDPMPSPGMMGASAIRQVCSPEIRLTEVRPAQVCSPHVCSQSVRVAQIRLAQARLAPISPAGPPPTQVRPAQNGAQPLRLNQARGQGAQPGSRAAQCRAPQSAPRQQDGRAPSGARRGRRGRV